MTLINPRNVQNKSGTVFNAGSLTYVYAEDYKVYTDALKNAGSEVYLWLYNVTTSERDSLSPSGAGTIVFNTTTGSPEIYNGSSWTSMGGASGLPQGVLPLGSIPNLTGSYIPQGQLVTGSLPNDIIVSGSVIASHGSFTGSLSSSTLKVVPGVNNAIIQLNDGTNTSAIWGTNGGIVSQVGSAFFTSVNGIVFSTGGTRNTMTSGTVRAKILPNGDFDLNNRAVVLGSNGTGSFISTLVASNLSGTNTGDQTNISGSAVLSLPQGVLPSGSIPSLTSLYIPQGPLVIGSIPSLTSLYIPQGAIPYGSLNSALPQGVLPVGSIPSLTAYIPQGVIPLGSLTLVLPQGVLPVGSIPSLTAYIPQGVLPVGSIPSLTAYIPQGQLVTGSLPNTISISGSVVAPYGSFSDKTVSGSVYITQNSFMMYNAATQSIDFSIL